MNQKELEEILKKHKKWLNNEAGGESANLIDANLRGANLGYANLIDANLRGADLRGANLDFSVFPLWCGSFNMKVDDNILEQLLTHIKRLNVSNCTEANKKLVKRIPKRVEKKLKKRHDI